MSTPSVPPSLPPSCTVVCAGLSFAWPDGTRVLNGLDLTVDAGRTAIVGRNGSGKSTLLHLIAELLTPTAGTVRTGGTVALLPQQLPLAADRTVADLVGIAAQVAAVRAITAGDTSIANFTTVGDDWNVEQRALATLERLGLPADLDRTVATLSGGEAVLTGIAGLQLAHADVTLLDEPTNNLDRPGRERLQHAVRSWPGTLLVVSHDRELLDCVERVVELRDNTARIFGGTFSEFRAALEVEQQAAARAVRDAESGLRKQRRDQVAAQTALDHRARTARRAEHEKRVPKIVSGLRSQEAQVSAGKYRQLHADRVDAARAALTAAEAGLRSDAVIRVDLPATAVPAGRTVLDLDGLDGLDGMVVRGPERIALRGRNGSGKTTLLRRIVPAAAVPVGYLPQHLDVLDPTRSVLDNVRDAAPAATAQDVRARLARFLLRGAQVEREAATLSGGERFRASLARLLLADPAPQLLVLDEPTNNLDLDSVAQLVAALQAYRGALIVTSHDEVFLAEIGIDRWWTMDGGFAELPGRDETRGREWRRDRTARR